MKISVEQSGGFAGQTTHLADIDTEQLDPAAAHDVEQLVKELGARAAQPEPAGMDLMRYTIEITDGGAARTIGFTDDGSPEMARMMLSLNRLLSQSSR
jgi:hypothetical protein